MKYAAMLLVAALLTAAAATARAHEFLYDATLTAPPGSGSSGSGHVSILLDLDVITMEVDASFANLSSTTTAAHVRGSTAAPLTGTAPVASLSPTLTGFPVGVNSGTYIRTIDLTQAAAYDPGFIAASGGTVSDALNALVFGMADGRTYFEIGTTASPEGGISGFLTPTPEPAALSPCAAAVAVLRGIRRPRRRHAARGVPMKKPRPSGPGLELGY